MTRILVTYATFAGSTAEVARAVAEEIALHDVQVDVLPIAEIKSLADYDKVVVGAPMIMGWQRDAIKFLKRNRAAFEKTSLAIFVLAMSLTQSGETNVDGVPVVVDEALPKPPASSERLTLRERYTQLPKYLRPILKAAHPAKPVSIGVFGGRLEYGRLPWWAILFVMLIIQAPVGDRRNWTAIRSWAAGLARVDGLGSANRASETGLSST